MTSFLDNLEGELVAAVERHAEGAQRTAPAGASAAPARAHGQRPEHRRRLPSVVRRAPARLLLAAALIVLALSAAALAATGMLFTGSSVPPPHLAPRVGLGIPAAGRSRLIARSAADPAGGPRWSMRVLHTTRGMVCVQVGRLRDGRVGVIGEDGAFHDDGLFHPFSRGVLAQLPGRFATACKPQGVNFEDEVEGMPESGEYLRVGSLDRPAEERRLYFGLLGPSAVSVSYKTGNGVKRMPVEAGTGAFLIVLASKRSPKTAEYGGSEGVSAIDEGRIRAEAPITAITYRVHGRLCEEGHVQPIGPRPCQREAPARLRRRMREAESPRSLHVPIRVTLHAVPLSSLAPERTKGGRPSPPPPGAVKGVYYAADIAFRAPFAVAGANSGYSFTVNGAGGTIERDVRKGAIVHISEPDVFANADGGSAVVDIYYHDLRAKRMRPALVGRTTVREP